MGNCIFDYMKETSRLSDSHTLSLLEVIKDSGRGVYDYASHLPVLRNRLNGDPAIPKARNSLGRLVYECFAQEGDFEKIIPALSFIELPTVATYVLDDIIDQQEERQADKSTWRKYDINKGVIAGGLQTFIALHSLRELEINSESKIRAMNLAHDMWLKLWIGEGFNEDMKSGTH